MLFVWEHTKSAIRHTPAMSRNAFASDKIAARMHAIRMVFRDTAKSGDNKSAFARWLEVSENAWINYENEGWRPELDAGLKIQAKTGISLDWIYTGDERYLPVHLAEELRKHLNRSAATGT